MKRSVDLVSVIIPVFNVLPYLRESLDSVIHQTYENLEIIIIDDGSTDDSGRICDEYAIKDKRIKVIHQQNKGLSAARNAGLDIMTGDAVAFLDSDDAYHTEFIQKMTGMMNREEADIVVCKYSTHYDEKRNTNEAIQPSIPQGRYDRVQILRYLADNIIDFHAWNKVYRSELWKDIRFPTGRVYEDISTVYQIFDICNSVHVIDKPLYQYRIRKDSITQVNRINSIRDRQLAYCQFESFMQLHNPEIFSDEQIEKRRRSNIKNLIYLYGEQGKCWDINEEMVRQYVLGIIEETGFKY